MTNNRPTGQLSEPVSNEEQLLALIERMEQAKNEKRLTYQIKNWIAENFFQFLISVAIGYGACYFFSIIGN